MLKPVDMERRLPQSVELSPLRWFLRLRWLAVAGQGITLCVASGWLQLPMNLAPLLGIVCFTALSTFALSVLPRSWRTHPSVLPAVLLTDVLLLTLLLYFSGGPANPFSILYLLHVVVCAVLLSQVWTWLLATSTIALFGLLFIYPSPAGTGSMPEMHAEHGGGHLGSHLLGMWIAYSIVAVLSAYCIGRISEQRRLSEQETERLRLSQQKLASLTTLAAGAAHELATPLGTIAVVLGELEFHLGKKATPELREDLDLMKLELTRCKNILQQMGERSGEVAGEMLSSCRLADFMQEATEILRPEFGELLEVRCESENTMVSLPKNAIFQALRAMTKNGVEAAAGSGAVQVRATASASSVVFQVRDQGSGMSAEVLARAGEPFFTTKDVGKGMGLGIFLSRLTAERLGGGLSFRSELGQGTQAELRIPI